LKYPGFVRSIEAKAKVLSQIKLGPKPRIILDVVK